MCAGVRHRAVVVAVMVALAGCGAFDSPDVPSETLTPVPLPSPERPTVSQTPPSSQTPVTAAVTPESDVLSVDEVGAIGVQYADRLRNDSYRLRIVQRVRVNGSVVATSNLTRRVAADGRSFTEQLTQTSDGVVGSNRSTTIFSNASLVATRFTTDAGPEYSFTSDPLPPSDLPGQGQLTSSLRVFAPERLDNESQAGTVVVVSDRIRNPRAMLTPGAVSNPRNGTLVLRLPRNGTVSLRTRFTVTIDDGRTGEITRLFEVDRLNSVSVSPPPWLPVARAGSDATSAD